VVKWISQLTSDQLFWVRVLAGAQNTQKPALLQVFVFDVSRSDGRPAGQTARRGRENLQVTTSKLFVIKKPTKTSFRRKKLW